MPVHYNDNLDDQLVFDLTGSFIGGQVSNVRSNLLKDVQFSESENMDIDKFGAVITRRGTVAIGSTLSNPIMGLTFYDKPGVEELFCVSNGGLSKSTGGAWSSVSGYSPASSNSVEFAQLVDKLYMTDDSVDVHSYNGTTVTGEGSSSTDPPKCKFLISHTNRLFAANTENYNDEVFASDLLDGGTWNDTMAFRVGGGEGDPITGVTSWYNFNLLVFKKRSIHVVSTNPGASSASTWNVHRIDNTVGCEAHRTIAQAGADVFFLARDGVRTVKTILAGAQSSVSEPISVPVDDLIQRINWTAADKSCATFWGNRYILSVPLDGATTPNYTLVFNTTIGAWSGYWTGWTPRVFTVSSFSDYPKMVFGDNSGSVVTWRDFVTESSELLSDYQDSGSDYSSMILSRGHVFGDHLSPKLGRHVEVEFENSTAGCHCASILTRLDGSAGSDDKQLDTNVSTTYTDISLPLTLPFALPSIGTSRKAYNLTTSGEFSEAQFRVKSTSGKLHLRSIKASAYMNTMVLEK